MNKLFLAEERNRLGIKAKDVADFVGIAIPTQSNYEQGKRFPDAQYLLKISELGFDLHFVLTGIRNSNYLTSDETVLIELYRKAPLSVQKHIMTGLQVHNDLYDSTNELVTPNTISDTSVTVGSAGNGNNIGGINNGNISGRDMYINDSKPCKNGDGNLSAEDYKKMPYCNNCIANKRRAITEKNHIIACISGGMMCLVALIVFHFITFYPVFIDYFLEFSNSQISYQLNKILSTITILSLIFIVNVFIGAIASIKYNNKHYAFHK